MPPFRVRPVDNSAPVMRPSSWYEKLYDALSNVSGALPGFPPAEIARQLAPQSDVMPMTTVLPGAAAEEVANLYKPIKAYHGSPHDFDQFSLSKIGTGEGAQAYGHGLYFAENPSVANEYRVSLAQKAMRQQKAQNAKDVAASLLEKGDITLGNRPYKASRPGEAMNLAQDIEEGIVTADLLPDWAQKRLGLVNPARTYEVNIHASPDELLDWDKPLSQQPPKVQEASRKLLGNIQPVKLHDGWYSVTRVAPDGSGQVLSSQIKESTPDAAMKNFDDWIMQGRGENFYRMLGEESRGPHQSSGPVVAAEKLKGAGIKGIQYLDQGSRGPAVIYDVGAPRPDFGPYSPYTTRAEAEKQLELLRRHGFHDAEIKEQAQPQTKNFVIWDDKIIEIAKKYGITLAAAAELLKQQSRDVQSHSVQK